MIATRNPLPAAEGGEEGKERDETLSSRGGKGGEEEGRGERKEGGEKDFEASGPASGPASTQPSKQKNERGQAGLQRMAELGEKMGLGHP